MATRRLFGRSGLGGVVMIGACAVAWAAGMPGAGPAGQPPAEQQTKAKAARSPKRVVPAMRAAVRAAGAESDMADHEKLQEDRTVHFRGAGSRERRAFALVEMAENEALTFKDPFGARVLTVAPTTDRLSRVIEMLKAGADNPHRLFVVSEWIKQGDASAGPPARRCVIAFTRPPLNTAVMISVSFTESQFPEQLRSGDLAEVWGWDDERGVFHFYEWAGSEWAFVGSTPRPREPQTTFRCLECHRSGMPVMKELRIPWGNWESTESPNAYLRPNTPASWTVTGSGFPPLADARELEGLVKTAIVRGNLRAVERHITPAGAAPARVDDVKELLRPLFSAREFNLASSRTSTRLGVADPPFQPTPPEDVSIPSTFFLNTTLMSGDVGIPGLGIPAAAQFVGKAKLPIQKYADLVRNPASPLKLSRNGRANGIADGLDATFAWLTPERSFVDDHHVQVLMSKGVVNSAFVATVLLTDLRRPVFSADLQQIYSIPSLFPDSLELPVAAISSHKDHPLTRHVLGRLAVLAPAPGSVADRFRSNLNLDDPVRELRTRVNSYLQEVERTFQNGDAARIESWFNELLDRRRTILADPAFQRLDETRIGSRSLGLLPLP